MSRRRPRLTNARITFHQRVGTVRGKDLLYGPRKHAKYWRGRFPIEGVAQRLNQLDKKSRLASAAMAGSEQVARSTSAFSSAGSPSPPEANCESSVRAKPLADAPDVFRESFIVRRIAAAD